MVSTMYRELQSVRRPQHMLTVFILLVIVFRVDVALVVSSPPSPFTCSAKGMGTITVDNRQSTGSSNNKFD